MIREVSGFDARQALERPRAQPTRPDASERFELPELDPREAAQRARGAEAAEEARARRAERRDDSVRDDDDERDDDDDARDAERFAQERALAGAQAPIWDVKTGEGAAATVAGGGAGQLGSQGPKAAQGQVAQAVTDAEEGAVATTPEGDDAAADEAGEAKRARAQGGGAIAADEADGADPVAETAARRATLRAAAQAATGTNPGSDAVKAGATLDDMLPAWLVAGQRRDPAGDADLGEAKQQLLLNALDAARSAQRAEAAQRVEAVKATSLADEVTEALRGFLRDSGGEGLIKIDSARLGGRLSALVRVDGGELFVQLRSDDPAMKALIAGALDDVCSALEAAGLGLGGLSVSVDDGADPRDGGPHEGDPGAEPRPIVGRRAGRGQALAAGRQNLDGVPGAGREGGRLNLIA